MFCMVINKNYKFYFFSDHKYNKKEESVEKHVPKLELCVYCNEKFKGLIGLQKHEKHCDAFKKMN